MGGSHDTWHSHKVGKGLSVPPDTFGFDVFSGIHKTSSPFSIAHVMTVDLLLHAKSSICDLHDTFFNPVALSKAKIVYNFGFFECSRVN